MPSGEPTRPDGEQVYHARLGVSVRDRGDYWVATASHLGAAFGIGATAALAVEDCLEDVVRRARYNRKHRSQDTLGVGLTRQLEAWERWCEGDTSESRQSRAMRGRERTG